MSNDPIRGSAEVLTDVIRDLRDYTPLTDLLPEPDPQRGHPIFQGHPTNDRGYGCHVVITPIYVGSTPHRGVRERNYRIQVTVAATYAWLEEHDAPGTGTNGMIELQTILDRVGDRLDRAQGILETAKGGAGSPEPHYTEDDRLVVIGDWRLVGYYDDPVDGN